MSKQVKSIMAHRIQLQHRFNEEKPSGNRTSR